MIEVNKKIAEEHGLTSEEYDKICSLLKKTPNLEAAILRDARGDEMLEVAIKDGFKTMQVIGRNFIKKGILSVEEYSRILVV